MNGWTSLLLVVCCGALHVMATEQPENHFSYVLNQHKQLWDRLDEDEIARLGIKMRAANYTISYLPQPLDHFEVQTTGQYQQKYYVVDQYWRKPDGPVFLYIGGEWTMNPYEFSNGPIADLAVTEGALILAVEHRFYGIISQEYMKLDQLNYLSSQQALADLVSFHAYATKTFKLTEKNLWISFGCSYPGALTAWFRLKYPHLVHGAVSSSGPVRAAANFREYNEVVTSAFGDPVALGSEQCVSRIKSAFQAVGTMLANEQWSELQQAFNICLPLTDINDRKMFASTLQDTFMGAAQYNVLYASTRPTVGGICNIMTNESFSDPLDALKAVYFKHVVSGPTCTDASYSNFINFYRNDSHVTSTRPWLYQTCTEYGYYQTCDADTNCMFLDLVDLDWWLQVCKDIFGVELGSEVLDHVDFTNSYYGADKPWGSRIVFANGDLDPWHALGVKENLAESMKAVMIRGGSHCQDTRATTSYDTEALKAGRIAIKNEVKKWLASPGYYQPEPEECPSSADPLGRSFQPTLIMLGVFLGGCLKR
ncbi:thymus-specific serine protease-like [Patiria miniata]|uniref:Serine protease K12H4.7 n=1 Tax=Patiria miniata TaxID=46514 RepID=A0A913ZCX3_PATMI|nr:thymus-specific serine protease-like [Patiria miniata]